MESNLRKAQLRQVHLLAEFKKICEDENIPYFLLGGTVIGAIRHKGFIPWDDDIDVGLPRQDYDRFIEIAQDKLKENIKIQHWSITPNYTDYTMKLVDTSTFYVMKTERGTITRNIWIDIFPLDGMPTEWAPKKMHLFRLKCFRLLRGLKMVNELRVDKNRGLFVKLIIILGKTGHLDKAIDLKRVNIALDKELKKYSIEKTGQISNYMGAYHERETFPISVFGNGCSVEFEGQYYNAPKKVHEYLTIQYGNYMKLPPIEKRIPKHNIMRIIFEEEN